jgi:homoserine acetyltransferase
VTTGGFLASQLNAVTAGEAARPGSDRLEANDILGRNNAMAAHDVAPNLPKVKAKVLVVGLVEDELFPP